MFLVYITYMCVKQKIKKKIKYDVLIRLLLKFYFVIKRKCFLFLSFNSFQYYRSICENCNHAKWQTFEKEEDKYQKMHPQPLL